METRPRHGASTMASGSTAKPRVASVDALRGVVMIIMALDHTREYFHSGAMQFNAEDLSRTTAAIFLTRWITHICAPVFMFTAGLGAFFWMARGRTRRQLSRFLWTRGLWLVLLELTAWRVIMNFSYFTGPVLLSILWALGWSMVALGFLAWLPVPILTALSLTAIALHNLADPVRASQFGHAGWMWNILHQPGIFRVGAISFLVAYPLVPWLAVMALGFAVGRLMTFDAARRRRWLVAIGLGLIAAFLALRAINIYGDPQPWTNRFPGMTVLSFLRCTKYPPSLDFLLMTLGPAILLLAWFDGRAFSRTNPLIVFGRVPLFYFLAHLALIHALTIPFALVRYGRAAFLLNPLPSAGGPANLFPADYGYPLGVVYAVWAGVVVSMYPLSLWFSRVKDRRRDWWLSYL